MRLVHDARSLVDADTIRAANSDLEDMEKRLGDPKLGMIGTSNPMREVFQAVSDAAPYNVNVMILGETGTGKELVARGLNSLYLDGTKPFVGTNCTALPSELLESLIFGHKRGAFTGAYSDQKGLFEIAGNGTVFLDEIGDMPQNLQTKLLRVLQEKEVRPLGSRDTIQLNNKTVSATNADIAKSIEQGSFRMDLYFRLNVVQISVPPLRDYRRQEDIEHLANYYHYAFSVKYNKKTKLTKDAIDFLMTQKWPGNIRELSNFIERAVLLYKKPEGTQTSNMDAEYLSKVPQGQYESSLRILPDERMSAQAREIYGMIRAGLAGNLKDALRELESRIVAESMTESHGVQKKAAEILGISPRTLHYFLNSIQKK